MEKHNFWSNWSIVFMSDIDKQTLVDLYAKKLRNIY